MLMSMVARTQTQARAFDPRRWVLLATLALLVPTAAAQRTFEEFADDTRAAILDGLERIPAPGVPGRVAVFGEHALSVFALEKAGAPRTVIAAARPRRGGRVVAFGHGGYLSRSTLEDENGGRLVRQALEWAAGDLLLRERDRVFLVGAPALREPLEEWGYEVELRDRLDDEPQLVILGRVDLDEAEQEAFAELIEARGGVLCAGTGWGWMQLNRGRSLAEDFGLNRALAPLGLAIADGTLSGRDGRFEVEPGVDGARDATGHAGSVLKALVDGEEVSSGPRSVLLDAVAAAPEDGNDFASRAREIAETRLRDWRRGKASPLSPDPRDALAVSLLWRSAQDLAADAIEAFPGHEQFPGTATKASGRPARTGRVEAVIAPGPRGRRSLGVWIPAGSPVEVEVTSQPAGARWRVGAHSDSLWTKPKWSRWPSVSRTWPIDSTHLASPFGGLLYLELDQALNEPITVRVDGAIEAPTLRAGADARAMRDFTRRLESFPADALAPWVELIGDHVTLTVPLDAARACVDPGAVIDYWDRTWIAHTELLGAPIADRPERFVFDTQISAGWMHSGYPIMAHLASARPALDVESLTAEGDWGLFHELGHNSQARGWTSGNMGEVTCNLFALHAMERMAGIDVADHPRGGGLLDELDRHRRAVAAGEAGFEELRSDPFRMLAPFVELQLAFGWEPFTAFFDEHRAATRGEDPRGLGVPRGPDRDQAVRDQWAERFSRIVERDVSEFLAGCGWPISTEVRARLSELEPFDPPR